MPKKKSKWYKNFTLEGVKRGRHFPDVKSIYKSEATRGMPRNPLTGGFRESMPEMYNNEEIRGYEL